jgi:hypothetical protein
MKAETSAANAAAMIAAALVRLGAEARQVNAEVATVLAGQREANAVPGVHHRVVRIAATAPGAKDLAVGVINVTNANAAKRLRLCRRLALLCFRTTKASNRSRARFE